MEMKLKNSEDRINAILAKGQDMTTDEIIFLKNKDVQNVRIQKALGVNSVYFKELWTSIKNKSSDTYKFMKGLNAVKKQTKSNREIIIELTKKGLSPKEVHQQTGLSLPSIYTYRSELKKEEGSLPNSKTEKVDTVDSVEVSKLELEIDKLKHDNFALKSEVKDLEALKTEQEEALEGRDFEILRLYEANRLFKEDLERYSSELAEIDKLRQEIERLTKELELTDRQCADVRRILDIETNKHTLLRQYLAYELGEGAR